MALRRVRLVRLTAVARADGRGPAPKSATPPAAPSAIFSQGASESAAPPEPVDVTKVLRKTGTASRIEAEALARRAGLHSR